MEAENNITKQMKEAARNAESKPFPGMERVWDKVTARLDEETPETKVVPFLPYKKMVAAAAVLILLGLGAGYFLAPKNNGITIAVNNFPAATKTSEQLEKVNMGVPDNDKQIGQEKVITVVNREQRNDRPNGAHQNNREIGFGHAEKENNDAIAINETATEAIAPVSAPSIVKGTIVDENGEGVVGANIKIKGTNVATQTDVDGNYELQIKTLQPTIEINSLGYESKEISIAGNYTLGKIQLAPNKDVLTEVVGSTSYGPPVTRSKYVGSADVIGSKPMDNTPVTDVTKTINGVSPGMQIPTGNEVLAGIENNSTLGNHDVAYQTVGNGTITTGLANRNLNFNTGFTNTYSNRLTNSKLQTAGNNQTVAINNAPVSNTYKAIDGATPGVQITSGSSASGPGSSVQIRDKGSLNPSGKPMYVIDGVPYDGDINAVNPAEIATVTVLKDTMATSLYGARGTNGVILITTKSGQSGTAKKQWNGTNWLKESSSEVTDSTTNIQPATTTPAKETLKKNKK